MSVERVDRPAGSKEPTQKPVRDGWPGLPHPPSKNFKEYFQRAKDRAKKAFTKKKPE